MSGVSLKDQAFVQKALAYYSALDDRERLMVNALAVFLAVVVILTQILLPSMAYKDQAKKRYQSALEDYQWMQANAPKHSASSVVLVTGDQSMISKVTNAAKSTSLTFKRYDNLDENRLRVVVEQQSFKQVLAWLQYLEKNYAISVTEISVDRQESAGVVNVRVLLQG